MEKFLKSNVYYNDTVISDTAEVPIDVDFTLPDYCPDIAKIFKLITTPYISSKSINGSTLLFEGSLELNLLYADKDGELCSFSYQYPFSKSIEAELDMTGVMPTATIKCDYINCRAVSPRKVDIHGACALNIKVEKRKCCDIVSDYDDANIELKKAVTPATVPIGCTEKYILLEDEIHLGDNQSQIKNVLRNNTAVIVKETKIINGKAVVKGEMAVAILYCAEGARSPQALKTVIPFSQILDIDGINEECECETKASLAFCEIKPKTTVQGECKAFSLTAKILLCANAFCGNDIPIIEDAFSRKYAAEIKRDKICFEKICQTISETQGFKNTVKIEDGISSVIDIWGSIAFVSTKFEDEFIHITASLNCGIVLVCENDNSIYIEKPLELEMKYPLKGNTVPAYCQPQIEIESMGYTILSADSIEIRADLSVNAAIYECREIAVITELSVDESRPITKGGRRAMTIYFPHQDECVWDIARTYNASVEEIMRINGLEDQQLKLGKMLLVPIM